MHTHTHAGGLLMGPIAADYLHVPSSNPTVMAVVNEAASACNGSCSFVFDNGLAPTLSNAAETSRSADKLTTFTLSGSSLLPPEEAEVSWTQIQVYFSAIVDVKKPDAWELRRLSRGNTGAGPTTRSSRSLLSVNQTSETISRSESCTIVQATNESITCKLAPATAGVYSVAVVVPGRGTTPQNVTLTYALIVDSVTPSTVSA
jgi:hypothetical protein